MAERKHKHHIIPRHAGGTDDPSNIVELTIPEHAEAHRKLYEEHGRWQDKIAYQVLAGQMSITEAQWEAKREGVRAFHTGRKCTEEHKEKTRQSMLGKNKGKTGLGMAGKKHTPEAKEKNRTAQLAIGNRPPYRPPGWKHSPQAREEISAAAHKQWETRSRTPPREKCDHCGMLVSLPMLARWHNDNCRER